jgi:hypothetical protein
MAPPLAWSLLRRALPDCAGRPRRCAARRALQADHSSHRRAADSRRGADRTTAVGPLEAAVRASERRATRGWRGGGAAHPPRHQKALRWASSRFRRSAVTGSHRAWGDVHPPQLGLARLGELSPEIDLTSSEYWCSPASSGPSTNLLFPLASSGRVHAGRSAGGNAQRRAWKHPPRRCPSTVCEQARLHDPTARTCYAARCDESRGLTGILRCSRLGAPGSVRSSL